MQYTVKAAARATGISEARLRTWERRYGVPKPPRSPTGRRLYEEADIAVIRRMATLVGEGLSAAQAAAATQASDEPTHVVAEPPEPLHALSLEIVTAASKYAEDDARRALRAAVTELGWPSAIDDVIFPALREVGAEWARGNLTPAHEHFVSQLVRAEIVATVHGIDSSGGSTGLALVACPAGESHELSALALALLLRQSEVGVIQLGADVPTVHLIEAAHAIKPDAICLSATSSASLPTLGLAARALVQSRLSARLYVGGPALADRELAASIPGILLPARIEAAARTIADAIGHSSA